jgi:hypothetical protein
LYDAIADLEETARFKAAVFHVRPPGEDVEPISVSSPRSRRWVLRRAARVQPAREVAQLARADEQARRGGARWTHGTLGLELALVSDLRLATATILELRRCSAALRHVGLPARCYVGLGTAKQTILLGHPISADMALRYGVIDKVVGRT